MAEINAKRQKIEYKCPYAECSSSFTRRGHLEQHQRIHSQEKLYQCKMCNKSFTQTAHLTTHMMIHTQIKPFRCIICEKTFRQNVHLRTHMTVHTKEKAFECDICHITMSHKSSLVTHYRVHTRETPYECTVCKRLFSHSGTLRFHRMSHTGEFPHVCTTCGMLFRRSERLKAHIESRHSGKIVLYEKKQEKIIHDLLVSNNITFDSNVSIDFCKQADSKNRAFIDFMIQTDRGILILEVDEFAHEANNLKIDNGDSSIKPLKCESDEPWGYNVICEQARVLNIVNGLRLANETRPIHFIRYNPHSFKINGVNFKVSVEERHKRLLKFIETWTPKQDFTIHYCCYDYYVIDSNTRRCTIWDHKDFDSKLLDCVCM